MKKRRLPIILYEDTLPGEKPNEIPYIEVAKDEESHSVIFVSEYRETGEFEVSEEMGSAPIVDMLIHAYVNMDTLKKSLTPELYDVVRVCVGMKPLLVAAEEGQKILDQVNDNAEAHKKLLEDEESQERADKTFALGEDFRQKANRFLKEEEKDKEN